MSRPRIVLTRRWPAAVEDVLRERYDVVANADDHPFSADELAHALATADAVPVYNAGWQIEQQFRDIKNRPLGIRPLHVTREDQIIGLTHLVTLALRIMTLIATTVRRSLARTGEVLHGLYEGQKVRTTAQPTGRRLLKAFHRHEITLTRIRAPGQDLVHVAPLPPALSAILKHLGLSDALYTDLAVAAK